MADEMTPGGLSEVPAEAFVAGIESRAERYETPCGEGTMVWRKWGAGPPLLFFHGAHGSWAHWIRNIDDFARTRTVWAPDLPGYGESALPDAPIDGDSFAAALATGIRQMMPGLAPVDIVGFSFGGVMATHLAAMAPELVRRIILVDTGGLETPSGEVPAASLRGLTDASAIMAAHRQNLLGIMLHHPESVDPVNLYLQALNVPRGRVNPRPLVLPDRLVQALPRSHVPIDAIWGEFDRPHPDPDVQYEALKRFRPDARFRVVPDAGHWAMYERAEAFNRILHELLALAPR